MPGDLSGYRGTPTEQIEKVKHGLEMALKFATRLEEQMKAPILHPVDLHCRMENVRLSIRQCHLTMESLAAQNWEKVSSRPLR